MHSQLSVVGSVGATTMGFVAPAAVVLATMRKPKPAHTLRRAAAGAVMAVGAFLFINGFSVFVPGASPGGRRRQ